MPFHWQWPGWSQTKNPNPNPNPNPVHLYSFLRRERQKAPDLDSLLTCGGSYSPNFRPLSRGPHLLASLLSPFFHPPRLRQQFTMPLRPPCRHLCLTMSHNFARSGKWEPKRRGTRARRWDQTFIPTRCHRSGCTTTAQLNQQLRAFP